MIPSSRWPSASNRQAATATPRFDEVKIGEEAAITRHVSCMINRIITLPNHFVSLGLAFLENNRSTPLRVWGHDHDGAYRQLPLHDPRQAYVLLLTPDGPTLWSHNVLLFGSAASVWSYNRFGDVLVACSRTLVLSPALHYVDDYGSMEDELFCGKQFSCFRGLQRLSTDLDETQQKTTSPRHNTEYKAYLSHPTPRT